MSTFRCWISLRLSTEAAVTSAVACTRERLADDFRQAAAVRIVDAAGVAGGDRQAHDAAVLAGELAGIEYRAETAEDDRGDQQDDWGHGGKVLYDWCAAGNSNGRRHSEAPAAFEARDRKRRPS